MPLLNPAILAPITDEHPAGPDIRADNGLASPYFKLKDARAQARMVERNAEAAGEPVAVPAEWSAVRDIALDILSHRSKDIEVGAWLIEASLRLDGFRGAAEAFSLVDALVDRFWPDIHSIDEDDAEGRVSPLAGLNGIGGEGALVQPIRMVSLLPASAYGSHGLWHLSRAQKDASSEVALAFRETQAMADRGELQALAEDARAAKEAFAGLSATLDQRCGEAAPPSSNIRNVLEEVADAYRGMVGEGGFRAEPPIESAAHVQPEVVAAAPPVAASSPRELRTREDAFLELLRIADFFRRNEPHSPIAYTLTTLVARGRMGFVDLLQELLPDAAQRKQVLDLAGIRVDTDNAAQS